jgi:hypothetical protein
LKAEWKVGEVVDGGESGLEALTAVEGIERSKRSPIPEEEAVAGFD